MTTGEDVVKNREIRFAPGDASQAEKAMKLLVNIKGIEQMSVASVCLHIRYDVRHLTLQMLESALIEVGFKLDNSILTNMKRALCAYCEDAQRSTLGIEQEKSEHHTLSLSDQGTHDPRPDNWRHYV
jgi:hypothetical protein